MKLTKKKTRLLKINKFEYSDLVFLTIINGRLIRLSLEFVENLSYKQLEEFFKKEGLLVN